MITSYSFHGVAGAESTLKIDVGPKPRASGKVRMPGRGELQVVGGGTKAACGDANKDGQDGIRSLQVNLRDAKGKTVRATIRPDAGEVDTPGTHAATLELGGQRYPGKLVLRKP